MSADLLHGADGLPLELFHGSYHAITAFRPLRWDGVGGIYFTARIDDAWDYAETNCVDEDDVPTVISVHLRIRNPKRLVGMESHVLEVERINEIKAAGHDGVIGVDEAGLPFEYVAFDPAQIIHLGVQQRDVVPPTPK